MNGQENAAPNSRHSATAAMASSPDPWKRKPVRKPTLDRDEQRPGDEHRVGRRAAEEDRRPGDGQRPQPVEQAAVDILGDADGRPVPEKKAPAAARPGIRKSA